MELTFRHAESRFIPLFLLHKRGGREEMPRELDAELNALIADKVMEQVACDGYSQINLGSAGGPALRRDCQHEKDKCYPSAEIGSAWGKIGGCPNYSGEIRLAFEVVEKMRERGWSFACTLYEGRLPYASFCKMTAVSSRNAEAESLPEAICLAALEAVKEKQ
jgi:hypothetical protein